MGLGTEWGEAPLGFVSGAALGASMEGMAAGGKKYIPPE